MPSNAPNGNSHVCKRCGSLDAAIFARQDYFCQECFVLFVNTKVIKKMDDFRVRNATGNKCRKLLLPLSGGVSSMTLLHSLDGHAGRQIERTGRAGYQLDILFVDRIDQDVEQADSFFRSVKERYPRHEYHRINFSNDAEQSITSSADPDRNNNDLCETGSTRLSTNSLADLLTILPSSTSHADVLQISLTRTITQKAHELSCEAIIWGSTTTRLAERVLAETAKGRGFSLPWLVTDGPSPYYGLHFLYPMKDLLRKELPPYIAAVDLPCLEETSNQTSTVSSKNVTIDGLMKEYFESIEENYPNIVTNVVKTSSKLQTPKLSISEEPCNLCGMPVGSGAYGLHGWGGSDGPGVLQDAPSTVSEASAGLCYGCARSILNIPKARGG